jgi:hypothetical protein
MINVVFRICVFCPIQNAHSRNATSVTMENRIVKKSIRLYDMFLLFTIPHALVSHCLSIIKAMYIPIHLSRLQLNQFYQFFSDFASQ